MVFISYIFLQKDLISYHGCKVMKKTCVGKKKKEKRCSVSKIEFTASINNF